MLQQQTVDYLEGLLEGFVAYDGDWVMTYMNAAAERLLGRRRDDVLGRTWHQAFPHAVGNEVDHMYQRVMRTRQAERILNRTRNDVLGKTWYEAFPHAVGNPVDQMYQRVKRTRIAERLEYRYEHYKQWMEISAAPVRDGGVAVYFRDISERKNAEAALARSKDEFAAQVYALTRLHELALQLGGLRDLPDMLRATLETVADLHGAPRGVLWIKDAGSGTLDVAASIGMNPATIERARHLAPGPQRGPSGHAFELRRRVIVEDIETDETYAAFRDIARTGGFRSVHATPIVNRAAEILGVVSVHFPEPRRPTRMEMQFADMCARYAADAIETKHSEMALREADRRKDEFLATLAHELRNPLAPIRNGLYLLRLADRSSDAAEQARAMMDRQMNHLVRLVDDLLEVSRISTGKLELRKERVELASIVGSATETSRPVIDAKRHTLLIELPREALALHADPVRLAQVLANILNNAAKYTQDGGEIRLSVRREGEAAVITVRDNGIGIPPEMLPRIFDLFMQIDGAARHSQGGLGIGLTLARRLVELHDGSIEVRSEGLGRGSEFVVRLPVLALPDQLGGARLRGVAFEPGS